MFDFTCVFPQKVVSLPQEYGKIMYQKPTWTNQQAMFFTLGLLILKHLRNVSDEDGIDALYGNKSPKIGFSTLPIIRSANTSPLTEWTF